MNPRCDICIKDKYIGFFNYVTKENYRLCQEHYYKWILEKDKITIGAFILKVKNEENKNQMRL